MKHQALITVAASAVSLAVGSAATYLLTKEKLARKFADQEHDMIAATQQHYSDLLNAEIDKINEQLAMRNKQAQYATPEEALIYYNSMREVKEREAEEDNPDEMIMETRGQRYRSEVAMADKLGIFPQRIPQKIEDEPEEIDHNGIRFRRKVLKLTPENRSELKKAADEALGNFKAANPDYVAPDLSSIPAPESGGEEVPYVISQDEFLEAEREYSSVTLTYYEGDAVLVDENDEVIQEVDEVVGEHNLLRFGDRSNDKHVVYIRNEEKKLDIELIQSPGKYSVDIQGIPDEEDFNLEGHEIRSHRRGGRG